MQTTLHSYMPKVPVRFPRKWNAISYAVSPAVTKGVETKQTIYAENTATKKKELRDTAKTHHIFDHDFESSGTNEIISCHKLQSNHLEPPLATANLAFSLFGSQYQPHKRKCSSLLSHQSPSLFGISGFCIQRACSAKKNTLWPMHDGPTRGSLQGPRDALRPEIEARHTTRFRSSRLILPR